jgi:hypothetical protein
MAGIKSFPTTYWRWLKSCEEDIGLLDVVGATKHLHPQILHLYTGEIGFIKAKMTVL